MKILAVAADITAGSLGGAEGHFVEVAKRIAPRVETLTVLTGPDDSAKELFAGLANITVKTVVYPHIPNLFGVFYLLWATPRALLLTRREKYDLVWAKQEYPQAQVGALVKMLAGMPLYITAQNPNLHKEELVLKGGWLARCKSFLTGIVSALIRFAFSRADLVAAVSRYSAGLAREYGAKRVVIIPNGVTPTKIKDQRSKNRADASFLREAHNIKNTDRKSNIFRIITVSSLAPRYGVDTLIEACAKLPKGISWRLVIAGDGPEKENYELRIENYGLQERVKLLGRVPNDKIPELLSGSDLFVRPSRAEGFGTAFLEAMAEGVPVIGTAVGGITDFIKDGETGLLVPPEEPEGLAAAIYKIYKNYKLYSKVRRNGLALVRERYNWERIAGRACREMEKLAAAGRQS